jgi:hypothetical protein
MSKHVSDDLKLRAVQHYLKNNNYDIEIHYSNLTSNGPV